MAAAVLELQEHFRQPLDRDGVTALLAPTVVALAEPLIRLWIRKPDVMGAVPVIQILAALKWSDSQVAALGEGTIGLGARILQMTLEFDSLRAQGHSVNVAIQTVRGAGYRLGSDG